VTAMTLRERVFRAAEAANRREILDTLLPRPGGILLDLGCGDGRFTMEVARQAGVERALGLELVDEIAEQARRNGVEVSQADLAERLPFDDASIDVVHSNQVIEHLSFTDHFLREIRRIVRPDGYAVLSTNNLASWHNVVSLVAGWQPPPCHPSNEVLAGNPANFVDGVAGAVGQMHLRIFTARALASVAAHHGLRLDADRGAGYYPLPLSASRFAARVDRRHAAFLVQRYVVDE
jgi:2-polyprenyl-3-methyl-5-hydroxy-6-metoxy-1,4-benzoquinol methylase